MVSSGHKNRLIIITGYQYPSINIGLAFQQRGYEVLFHKTISDAAKLESLPDTDAVLVHLPLNEDTEIDLLDDMLRDVPFPVIITESAPLIGQALGQWVAKLESKLASELMREELPDKKRYNAPSVSYVNPEKKKLAKVSARNVWVLGASFGGPDALRLFLRQLPVIPNLGLIVAQHIGVGFNHLLCEQLSRCTGYHVIPAEPGFKIFQGEIMIVPPDKLFGFDAGGRVILEQAPPGNRYSPSISTVMHSVARQFGRSAGVILFSGMGDDGRDVCEKVRACGTEIWAQTPQSCISASMPESAIKTGCVSKQGAPEQLAIELMSKFREGVSSDVSS